MTGKELKEFRLKAHLSQTDFGRKIHATQDQLSYWERRGGALIPDWAEANILREFVGEPLKQAAPGLNKEELGMILDEVLEDSSIHEIFERLLPWIRRAENQQLIWRQHFHEDHTLEERNNIERRLEKIATTMEKRHQRQSPGRQSPQPRSRARETGEAKRSSRRLKK
jgi:transcriptional regulator with XRE-family HTH domain